MTIDSRRINSSESVRPQLMITDDDLVRLHRCVASAIRTRPAPETEALQGAIARARIVHGKDVPRDVVTMRSSVRIEDIDAKTERQLTLVYPEDADALLGKVSVLAPIGAAIIGLRAGTKTSSLVDGRVTRIRVVEVVFQPQAARDARPRRG